MKSLFSKTVRAGTFVPCPSMSLGDSHVQPSDEQDTMSCEKISAASRRLEMN